MSYRLQFILWLRKAKISGYEAKLDMDDAVNAFESAKLFFNKHNKNDADQDMDDANYWSHVISTNSLFLDN